MKPYLLLLLMLYTVFCQDTIRIPIKKPPKELKRISSHKEINRWKREEEPENYEVPETEEVPEIEIPVFIYDPATYATVGVGTPTQQIPVLFDTYSNVTWLFNYDCKLLICRNTELFNMNKSTSKLLWDAERTYFYKHNSIVGTYTVESFIFGNFKVPKFVYLNVINMTWINLEDRSKIESFAGVTTLQFPQRTSSDLLSHLFAQKSITDKSFGLIIPRFAERELEGELIIGGYNDRFFDKNSMNWINVTSDTFWEFNADKVLYGKYGLDEHATMIVDTGVSIVVGPKVIINKLFNIIVESVTEMIPIRILSYMNDYNGYAVKCSDYFETFDFQINKQHYKLTPQEYLLPMNSMRGWCAFGFAMEVDRNDTHWRIGDIFLSKYYTVCNGTTSRLSFNTLTKSKFDISYN